MLTYLVAVSKGPAQRVQVLAQLVSALFDLTTGAAVAMKVPLWRVAVVHMLEVVALLEAHPEISLVDDVGVEESEEREEVQPEEGAPVKVWGNLVAFVERLDDELFKGLQVTDPHTHAYTDRLRDEPALLALAQKANDYLGRRGDLGSQSKVRTAGLGV